MFLQKTTRDFWLESLTCIARPVLEACASDSIKEKLPQRGVSLERTQKHSYLEALGRTVCGIAPWLSLETCDSKKEETLQSEFRELTRKSISNAVNEKARSFMNFCDGTQPLVDAAFMALGILRAKTELWDKLDEATKQNVIFCMKQTRAIKPWRTNWILFSSLIEVFLDEVCGDGIKSVIDYGISQFEQWYVGDGLYSDGKDFHFDYYNSIVIHPFLYEIAKRASWVKTQPYISRSVRYCEILERLIARDGTFPVVGRSIVYRGGVFHMLALLAIEDLLGDKLSHGSVRCAMTAVLKMLMAKTNFDKDGFLVIGVSGEQPSLGEVYINTGSLYLFTTMFLPLGLSNGKPFWAAPDEAWSSVKAWRGDDLQADKAL